jgi:hypothetical protein
MHMGYEMKSSSTRTISVALATNKFKNALAALFGDLSVFEIGSLNCCLPKRWRRRLLILITES